MTESAGNQVGIGDELAHSPTLTATQSVQRVNIHNSIGELFTNIADAIRSKTGSTNPIIADNFPTAIESIQVSGGGGTTDEGWIGDGNTHIWIELYEGRTSPMLGVCPNGTVTVDWGDGTTPDVLTGTSLVAARWTPTHDYAEPGEYVITLTVDGTASIKGGSSTNTGSYILRHSIGSDGRNKTYQAAIQKIEIGNGVTSCGSRAFSYCCSMRSITIPKCVTTISSEAFNNCYSLNSLVITEGVTSIDANAFNYCYGMRFYDFTSHTAVPTLSSASPFTGISSDCEIRVPAALYDEWIAATNWSAYADYIVGV